MIDRSQMTQRYQTARSEFLQHCQVAGANCYSIKHPLSGPSGEPLYIDVAQLGNINAEKVIFVCSGTHGIEAYLGSELQCGLLSESADLNHNLLIFIHGLNPHGMAWHRRVNENNVDLNRNFMDFDQTPSHNSAYDELSDLVNPQQLDISDLKRIEAELAGYVKVHGFMAFYKALSGGQYHFAKGVQYGGMERQWSTLRLNEIWHEFGKNRKLIINLDIHSGLGNEAEALVMINGHEDEPAIQRIRQHWPGLYVSPRATTETSLLTGILNAELEASFPQTEVIATTVEFGTQDTSDVTKAMIADNWLAHYGKFDSPEGQRIKQQILDAFYVDSDTFRDKVWQQGFEVYQAALTERPTGLSHIPSK